MRRDVCFNLKAGWIYVKSCSVGGRGCRSVGTASDWHANEIRFPGTARSSFLSESTFCADSCGVRTPPCAITCINICAHVKDPTVHGRVRWIMETLKHPTCTLGWVARLCVAAGFPRRKWTEFPTGEFLMGQYSCKTKQNKKPGSGGGPPIAY